LLTVLRWWAAILASSVTMSLVAGCAQTPAPNPPSAAHVPNPGARPVRNVTDFTEGLRCTDDLMLRFGTRDLVLVLEDVQDKTGHIPAGGAREMLISAVSDLTKRSRAVRLVAVSGDAQNLNALLQSAKRDSPFHVVPQYAWRGSFTQFDADIQTRHSVFGAIFAPLFNLGGSSDSAQSAIAMDANLVRTDDLTLVPSASSRNVIVITRSDSGGKGDAGGAQGSSGSSALVSKLGITYSFAVTSQDAIAQSARALVELAAIETIGRLAQVPYWKCLGGDEAAPDVAREIEDWFIVLERDGRLTSWIQDDLRTRRRFDGATDGQPSAEFAAAVVQARRDLGLDPSDAIDLALFRALIADRLPALPVRVLHAGGDAQQGNSEREGSLDLRTSIAAGAPGAGLALEIASRRDQFVYCYRSTSAGKVQRVFPNRFHPDPMLRAGRRIAVPGTDPFELLLDTQGDATHFACIASSLEIYNELPPKLRWGDFQDIGFKDLASLRGAFEQTAGSRLAYVEREVHIEGGK
jgi:hypothetical protein